MLASVTTLELCYSLALLLSAQSLAMLTPGPNMALLLSLAERRVQLLKYAVAGFACAGLLFSILSVAVLSQAYGAQIALLRSLLQLLGACYLLYLGTVLLRRWRETPNRYDRPGARQGSSLFVAGFATNVSNPKTLAFFTSILALYFARVGSGTAATSLAIGSIFINSLLVHALIGVALRTGPMRRRYAHHGAHIRMVTGGLFVVTGASLSAMALAQLVTSG